MEEKKEEEKQDRRRKIEEMEKGKGGTEERPKLTVTSERLKGPGLAPHPFCPMQLQKLHQPKILK